MEDLLDPFVGGQDALGWTPVSGTSRTSIGAEGLLDDEHPPANASESQHEEKRAAGQARRMPASL